MKKRTPDKRKLIRLSWYLAFIWLIFSALFFMYRHFDVTEHNNIRATIATAPVTTTAVMKEVNDRKGAHYGVFEFVANGKQFEGKTFTLYRGSVGDRICVTYNKARPADNIYCNDMAMEDYHETVVADSFRFSALMVALLAIAFALIILWGYITGSHKIMSEITTRN